jgi:hypothetical protein
MTKDEADHDIVVVGSREVLRSKTVRKKSEHWDAAMLISMEVGPWDLRRGTQTILKLSNLLHNLYLVYMELKVKLNQNETLTRRR